MGKDKTETGRDSMKKIVVVLPTFNEKQNIVKFTAEVLSQEKQLPGYRVEVLIVDSHSPDGTLEVARELEKQNDRVHVLAVGLGLGTALVEGHKYSLNNLNPDIMAQLDADGQVGADVLLRLVKGIEEGYSLVLGSRFVPGGKNLLPPSRRFYSFASSWFVRVIMGPFNIKEVTNSARAFTPELFKKINFDRMPWKEKTFIIQPAFLHEAILAGAKYKEVPLVFKNRAEGYSKMKVFNYTYDVITYIVDARLHTWGINFPLFTLSRRLKTFIKFGIVGAIGTTVDFVFYNFFIDYFLIRPATSKGLSTEVAIISNFFLNNFWTFRHRKTNTNIWQKLGLYNLVSLGGLLIGVLIVKLLHTIYGDGAVNILGVPVAYYNLYFFATIPPVMIWNFLMNHLITWRHQKED